MQTPPIALPSDFGAFIDYLNEHLQENGTPEVGYFQPLSRSHSSYPQEREQAFRAGLEMPVGTPGWRRAWVARGPAGEILGHIDLRGHSERYTAHPPAGHGVHRTWRRQGLGRR